MEMVILNISLQDSFDISKGVNGSALYYEVSYSIEENVCDTRNLSSTLCNQGVCSISFDVVAACRRRIGVIKISVTAFNRLGSGPPSQLILGMMKSNVWILAY